MVGINVFYGCFGRMVGNVNLGCLGGEWLVIMFI